MISLIPKQEMTNFNSFLKRHHKLLDMKSMSIQAFQKYEKQHGKVTAQKAQKNISKILEDCIKIETENFMRIKDEIQGNWQEDLLNNKKSKTSYPTIFKNTELSLNVLDQPISKEKKLNQIMRETSEITEKIVFGLKQSAKTRAGSCLENHLEKIFEILGFDCDTQETVDKQRLDFILPSLKKLKEDPSTTSLIECQTTLKDRFRLTSGKRQGLLRTKKYLATATGANVITLVDDTDITKEKLAELSTHGITLITFQKVRAELENKKLDVKDIISYEQFVKVWLQDQH